MKNIKTTITSLKKELELFSLKRPHLYFVLIAVPIMILCALAASKIYKWYAGLSIYTHSSLVLVSVCIVGILIGIYVSNVLRKPFKSLNWVANQFEQSHAPGDDSFTIYLENGAPLILKNIFNGVLIVGQPGSGKTASAIHPIIYQIVQKNWTGLIYDLKGKLADEVMSARSLIKDKSRNTVALKFINFATPQKSHRVNPIKPEYITNKAEVLEFVGTLLSNIMATDSSKAEDPFWFNNARNIFSAIIWFLKTKHPSFCTIPHAMAFVYWEDTDELLSLLQSDPECSRMLATLNASSKSKDQKLFINILSTLYTHLMALDLPELFFILTGDEINLNVNSPNNPTLLTIANHEPLQKVYSPIIALICNVVTQRMNEDGKCKGAIVFDEFASIKIPNFERTPETIRSRNVATVLALQDKQQLITKYGDSIAETIASTLATKFYFKSTNSKTVEEAVRIFGKRDVKYKTRTVSDASFLFKLLQKNAPNPTLSDSIQERDYLRIDEITNYERGQFAGIYSDASYKYSKHSQAKLIKLNRRTSVSERGDVSHDLITRNYHKVYADVESIFSAAKVLNKKATAQDVKIDF